MNQRGNVVVYVLFSLAASIAAGIGVYVWIRDHKPAEADADTIVPPPTKHEPSPPTPTPHTEAPVPAPVAPEPEVEPPAGKSVAEGRAADPYLDEDAADSPVFGVPGIDGAIDKSSVDRRFKVRAQLLQHCWERSGSEAGIAHITLAVEPNGHIANVSVSAGWNAAFETCVASLLGAMSFSGTHDGKRAEVVQPVGFH